MSRKNIAAGDAWLRGYASALGGLIRAGEKPANAGMIARNDGLTLQMFIDADVVDFDLRELRKAFQ